MKLSGAGRAQAMPVLVAVLGLVGLGACWLPDPPRAVDELSGNYVVNGVDPTGVEYSGTLIVLATDDKDRFELEWLVTGSILAGEGVLDGDELAATWHTADDRQRSRAEGAATYTVHEDGTWTGTRTVDGVPGTGTEEVFPDP